MDAATGWLLFAAFLLPWLAYDAWLWWSGRQTYSQQMYAWDLDYNRLPSMTFVALAVFFYWHFFGLPWSRRNGRRRTN